MKLSDIVSYLLTDPKIGFHGDFFCNDSWNKISYLTLKYLKIIKKRCDIELLKISDLEYAITKTDMKDELVEFLYKLNDSYYWPEPVDDVYVRTTVLLDECIVDFIYKNMDTLILKARENILPAKVARKK